MLRDLVYYQIGDDSSLDIAEAVVWEHWIEKHIHDLLLKLKS